MEKIHSLCGHSVVRRQLTASQRAMAAQALMPFLEAEAKERMLAGKRAEPDPSTNSDQGSATQHPSNHHAGKAAQHAAKLAGVGIILRLFGH